MSMLRIIGLFAFIVMKPAVAAASDTALVNQLRDHPSPYLAMHQDDPVHWQVWGQAALDKARATNRPILVSIGYFSCHWCHVMQRESFQDAVLAKLINTSFIPVKVDRELQPDLDAYLIDFVRMTHGNAGWPLTVLLTPDGYPLLGATYLPRDEFFALLTGLQQRWKTGSAELVPLAKAGMQELQQMRAVLSARQSKSLSFRGQFIEQVERMRDEMAGGFGQQSKFPMVSQLRALLWLRESEDDQTLDGFIRLTLDQMADQGLHDVLGGGFFRYVTDPSWQIPHYEKMLYDNARLALLYLQAGRQLNSTRYRDVGLGTVEFLVRDMRASDGYFISSFSAVDEQGREGYYYLWRDQDLAELLDEDELTAVRVAWFDDKDHGTEFGRLPRWQMPPAAAAKQLQWAPEKLERVLGSARISLLRARNQRALPADGKGLAAWNGLVLSALAEAYRITGEPDYTQRATELTSWILTRWWDGERLVRALQGDREPVAATLEDYALVAQGLWDWGQAKPGSVDEVIIERLVRSAWQRYFVNNRWVRSDAPLVPMLDGDIALEDGALPSASVVITELSRKLEGLRSDPVVKQHVNSHLLQVRDGLAGSAFWYAGYLELLGGLQRLP